MMINYPTIFEKHPGNNIIFLVFPRRETHSSTVLRNVYTFHIIDQIL